MKKRVAVRAAGLVATLVLVLPFSAGAQTLGEAAAKEKERRKPGKPARVITEDDLRRGASSRPVEESPAAAAEASPAPAAKDGKKEKTPDEIHAEAEKAWREKMNKAQEDLAKMQAEVDRIQAGLSDPANLQVGPGRASMIDALEQGKKQIAAQKDKVANLEEEGRRSAFR